MKNKFKVLLFILAVLLMGFASGLFYIAKEIDANNVKEIATEILESTTPGVKYEIESVDYTLGFYVVLHAREITGTYNGSPFSKVDYAEFRLPLWAVYFGDGNLDVKVFGLTISANEDRKNTENDLSPHNFELPRILERNKLNLRISGFKYDAETRPLDADLILFKNVNFQGLTGFEIIRKPVEESRLSFHLQIIGELELHKLLNGENADVSLLANITKIKSRNNKLQDIRLSGKGMVSTQGSANLSLEGKGNELFQHKMDFILTPEEIRFQNINGQINLKPFSKILGLSPKKVPLDDVSLSLRGLIAYSVENKKFNQDLSFELTKVPYFLDKNLKIDNSLKGSMKEGKLEAQIRSELFGGNSVTDIEWNKEQDIYVTTNITNLKFSKTEINKFLYGKSNVDRSVKNEERFLFPKFSWRVVGNNILVDNDVYAFQANLGFEEANLNVSTATFEVGEGTLDVKGMAEIQNNQHYQVKLSVYPKKVPYSLVSFVMPKILSDLDAGMITGEGHVGIFQSFDDFEYQIDLKANLKSGSLAPLNLEKYYPSEISFKSYEHLFTKKFDSAKVIVSLSNKEIYLQELDISYPKKQAVKANGKINLTDISHMEWKVIEGRKEILPMKLEGRGTTLLPVKK